MVMILSIVLLAVLGFLGFNSTCGANDRSIVANSVAVC